MNERMVVILKVFAWIASSVGAGIAVIGSASFWASQSELGGSIWPMPALVLIDWALLGLASSLGAINSAGSGSLTWQDLAWFCAGGLVPLVILGGFSIGPLVLVSLVPLLLGALSTSLTGRASLLRRFGILLIGAICNLILVAVFILVGFYFRNS